MKKIFIGLVIFCLTLFGICGYFYSTINSPQIDRDTVIYIKSQDSLDQVIANLNRVCSNIKSVKNVIKLKKYSKVKAGKYTLTQGMSANEIVNLLRSGKQTPVKVAFNNQNYIEDLAGRLATQIEADSISILKSLTETHFLKKEGFDNKTILNVCMPYTYECYWNISPEQLRNKFLKAYRRFWNAERIKKTQQLNLTQNKVIVLASIIQKETAHNPEKATIAGVYLNRLKAGIPLQADPTVIYALKEKYGRDTVIKRVLKKDLTIPSAYNTYLHKQMPPTAIAMPDTNTIDAVLNAKKHAYYYFCANPKKSGTHVFSKTLSQHNQNAKVYQRWLNKQKITR